jgi:hypothetical protein
MPPRFAYWTILLDGKPTAFRAAEQQELLPTFKRLQEKHPDAVMRWFARGKLWASPEEARAETARRAAAADAASRGRDWRPGGSHRDPRQPYKDAKKQRNQERRQRRFEFRSKDEQSGGWNKRPPAPGRREFKPWNDRPKPAGRWPRDDRHGGQGSKAGDGWSPRPARPREERPRDERPRGERRSDTRPPKKEWSGPPAPGRREFKPWNERPGPAGRRPRDDRQSGAGPKTGGGGHRPARPRDERPRDDRPREREFKPWNERPKPAGRWQGDRPPFKGPRGSAPRGGPRNKGPRGPKR